MVEIYPFKSIDSAMRPFGLSPIGPPANPTPQPTFVHDERLGGWIGPWLMSRANEAVVGRTYGLLNGTWGDKFVYREYKAYGSWLMCHVNALGLKLFGICLATPPLRWLLKRFGPAPGTGPTHETLQNGKYTLKILGETDEPEPKVGMITVSTERDIGYLLSGISHICHRIFNRYLIRYDVGRSWSYDGTRCEENESVGSFFQEWRETKCRPDARSTRGCPERTNKCGRRPFL